MKRKIITLLLLTFQTLAFADGSALLITLKGGRKAGYILSEKPVVTFGDGKLSIKVSDASTEYNMADLSTFTFVDESEITNINELPAGSALFKYRHGIISAEGANIQIFTLDGKLLQSGVSKVSVAGYPDGVYIVKMNNQIIKVRK